jgi:hypothetical protein
VKAGTASRIALRSIRLQAVLLDRRRAVEILGLLLLGGLTLLEQKKNIGCRRKIFTPVQA